MSRLRDMFLMGQRVSVTAKEEASRYDLPQVDVDHLLLALLVGGGPAGRLLRAQGLTLDAARRATEQVRAEHIARLGVIPPAAAPRPIRDPSLGEMDWTRRALKLMSSADQGELGLLTGLLDEPSGLVREVLAAADVDVEALRAAAAEHPVPNLPTPSAPPDSGWRAVSHTGFVLAPVAEVWALVSDATRRPEWDGSLSGVEPLEPGVWLVTWTSQRPDGRRVRLHPDSGRMRYRLTAYAPEEVVQWEITFPDRRDRPSCRQRFGIACRPAPGGTTIELTLSWPRRRGWRRLRQLLLEPAQRVVTNLSLVHYAFAISRRLR